MTSKLKEMKRKGGELRASMPLITRPTNVFEDEDEKEDKTKSFTEKLNKNLLLYKEIKMIYKKTGIAPAYFVYLLTVCLFFILIGYLESYLTHLIATLYPMYISYKTLQNESATKEDITQWLTYWVVYSFFINIEGICGPVLQFIPFYFLLKVSFLLLLILPQYNGAAWIYEKIIKNIFYKYENHIVDFSKKVVKTISNVKD